MTKWIDGDIVTWMGTTSSGGNPNHVPKPERKVAIRRDYGWNDGEWQGAVHGFQRIKDEFVTEMVNAGKAEVFRYVEGETQPRRFYGTPSDPMCKCGDPKSSHSEDGVHCHSVLIDRPCECPRFRLVSP